jgi:hypothetical protein
MGECRLGGMMDTAGPGPRLGAALFPMSGLASSARAWGVGVAHDFRITLFCGLRDP